MIEVISIVKTQFYIITCVNIRHTFRCWLVSRTSESSLNKAHGAGIEERLSKMAVVNLLTSLSTTLTLLLLTLSSVTYGQVSSTIEFTEHCNLTLSSSTNVIYLSSPSSNVTAGIACQNFELASEVKQETINLKVITNNSNIEGVVVASSPGDSHHQSSIAAVLLLVIQQVDVRFNISTNTPLVAESIAVTVTASGEKNKGNLSIKLQLFDDRGEGISCEHHNLARFPL